MRYTADLSYLCEMPNSDLDGSMARDDHNLPVLFRNAIRYPEEFRTLPAYAQQRMKLSKAVLASNIRLTSGKKLIATCYDTVDGEEIPDGHISQPGQAAKTRLSHTFNLVEYVELEDVWAQG